MSKETIPVFLAKVVGPHPNSSENREKTKRLLSQWRVFKGDDTVLPYLCNWIEKRIETLIKEDETLPVNAEFEYQALSIKNRAKREIYREMLSILKE